MSRLIWKKRKISVSDLKLQIHVLTKDNDIFNEDPNHNDEQSDQGLHCFLF